MAVGKEVKTKIASISSTQKITSAMEMVAASKMRKAQDQMSLGKPYSRHIRKVVGHIAKASSEYKHHYLTSREVKRVGYILISTDRGLCGGLNINLFKSALKEIKSLLDKNVYQQFEEAIKDRDAKSFSSETTFIGINSAEVKEHQQNKNMLEVTVEFVSEIISCVKDKDNKVVSGDPEKIKKVLDTWKFSKDSRSPNPNWLLIDTQA